MAASPDWPGRLPRPSFMAIGDSLINGMRSMSINKDLAEHSIPAFIGEVMEDILDFSRFQPAQYPRSILIDVEDQIKRYADSVAPIFSLWRHLGQIKADAAENGRQWLDYFASHPTGSVKHCDNLAVAGAVIDDVFHTTGAHLEARLQSMAPVIRQNNDPLSWSGPFPAHDPKGSGNWNVGDVHMTLNARYLRDPANGGGLDGMTIVDIVAARRPKILLVDMGANHGLLRTAMSQAGDRGMADLHQFARDWTACTRELARLRDVEIIVMLLLPLPSQIPVLSPPNPGPGDLPAPTRPDHYFDSYVSAIKPVSGSSDYTGDQVKHFDDEVRAINTQVQTSMDDILRAAGKARDFVNLADLLRVYDYKQRNGRKLPGTQGRFYSNDPLGPGPRGGISGLDHAHPTKIAYRYVAEAVRKRLAKHGVKFKKEIDIIDTDDDFLTQPHAPTLKLLDEMYPYPGPSAEVESIELLVQKREIDRLLLRAPWIV